MPAYIIARFRIHDRESYDRYEAAFMRVFSKFQGKLLSVDEAPEVLEGDWDYTRSVLIEFPDKAAAKAWITSPEYRAIAKDRLNASEGQVIIVEGLPPHA
ncbi:DUF1330 domain-containing protein [Aurantiacibacter sediminis]|uniref:DUF1330 domain-containing protein n=1 Tax=Aurantiacibacter sediminis TaxID=2793064 RepID=A0ABS0N1N7_9SPHN|nr:DUF1330 domain-containing protein [Aurantiacibacter sediminis]MBH5321161.1 DUF1330 domain-containing protein [Aurantiacibacter sediminis]